MASMVFASTGFYMLGMFWASCLFFESTDCRNVCILDPCSPVIINIRFCLLFVTLPDKKTPRQLFFSACLLPYIFPRLACCHVVFCFDLFRRVWPPREPIKHIVNPVVDPNYFRLYFVRRLDFGYDPLLALACYISDNEKIARKPNDYKYKKNMFHGSKPPAFEYTIQASGSSSW